MGVVSVPAQSTQVKNPFALQSADSGQPNFSGSAGLLSPNLQTDLNATNPLDRIHVGEFRPRFNPADRPRILPAVPLGVPEGQAQDDTLCYSIRSYKVARDDPQSDSTHAEGYSTCQPARRFRVRTTEERVLPATP